MNGLPSQRHFVARRMGQIENGQFIAHNDTPLHTELFPISSPTTTLQVSAHELSLLDRLPQLFFPWHIRACSHGVSLYVSVRCTCALSTDIRPYGI